MRAVIQRVSYGSVKVAENNYEEKIGKGSVVLLGIKQNDSTEDVNFVADKCCSLRIFEDENEKMNLSIKDIDGEMLIISQFTLYGDAQKGNRPSFTEAADPVSAKALYEKFIERCELNLGKEKIKKGIFAAMMKVEIHNDGPVTIIVNSKNNP
jgi:D-tyrosyl-tRNA(Tyr) deacylase